MPDDTIVFGTDQGLWRAPATGGQRELLTTVDRGEGETWHVNPAILPDGETLVFGVYSFDAAPARIEALSLQTGERMALVEGSERAHYVPPGYLVYSDNEAGGTTALVWAVPFDPDRLEVRGEPVLALAGVDETANAAQFTLAGDGTLVSIPAGEGGSSPLVWVDRDGREQPLPLPAGSYTDARVSSDGSRLVTVVDPNFLGAGDLGVYDVATGAGIRLTQEGADRMPLWTPDNEYVVFSRQVSTSPFVQNLYRVRADGSDAPERLTTGDVDQQLVSLSPEGDLSIVTSVTGPTVDITSVRLDGDAKVEPVVSGPFAQRSGELSPDGHWLAYESDETGQLEVYVQPYPGPGPKTPVSIGGGRWPMWAPDGLALFYESAGRLLVRPVDTDPTLRLGRPEVLLDLSGYELGTERDRRQFDIAPEGDRFLMMKVERAQIDLVLNWTQELLERVPVP